MMSVTFALGYHSFRIGEVADLVTRQSLHRNPGSGRARGIVRGMGNEVAKPLYPPCQVGDWVRISHAIGVWYVWHVVESNGSALLLGEPACSFWEHRTLCKKVENPDPELKETMAHALAWWRAHPPSF
jgi:hypothetical protein